MYKLFAFSLIATIFTSLSFAQVAINTDGTAPDNSAMLDIKSTTGGLLVPRMTLLQRNSILSPATGLMIYQTDNNPGFYYNSGTAAIPVWIMAGTGSGWGLNGNSGTSATNNFIGTTDNTSLFFRANNEKAGGIELAKLNTSLGQLSLNSNTNGYNNVAFGSHSLQANGNGYYNSAFGAYSLSNNTNGYGNTAIGDETLENNTSGFYNSGVGHYSLNANTTGFGNCAIGATSLMENITGTINTALGNQALSGNLSGSENVAIGFSALYCNKGNNQSTAVGINAMRNADNRTTGRNTYNTAVGYESLKGSYDYASNTGQWNTAIGYQSMTNNSSGSGNVATGSSSLLSNTTGSNNAVYGGNALMTNTSGQENAAFGNWAMELNQIGNYNTAAGTHALRSNTVGVNNSALGYYSLYTITTGGYNTGLGDYSYPTSSTLSNWTGLGSNAGSSASISNSVEIGNTSVTRIQGQVAMSLYSDERIKDNVVANVPGLNFIMKLRPVTYNLNIHKQNEILYKGQKNTEDWTGKYDIEKIRMSGFIAQEVEKASTEIGYDFNGVDKPETADGLYGLRYSEFVVPLVKAVQEQQQQITDLKNTNQELQSVIQELRKANQVIENRLKALEGNAKEK